MAAFHIGECIRKTKQQIPLSAEEIRQLVQGVTAEPPIPDYQLAAWLMAVCFSGLNDDETAALTMAMRDSGRRRWGQNHADSRADCCCLRRLYAEDVRQRSGTYRRYNRQAREHSGAFDGA